MSIYEALTQSYRILAPHSDSQMWEFDNNLFHLSYITKHASKTDRIVDVGSGIGILALALKLLGFNVIGMDKYVFVPSDFYGVKDIENLKQVWKSNNLTVTSGDALQDKGQDNTTGQYDVAISIAVLEHQKDLKSFMAGLTKYIKTGGYIYMVTPNVANLLNRFRVLFGKAPMGNIAGFFKDGDNFTGHWREYTKREVEEISKLAGLTVVDSGNPQTLRPNFTKNYKKWHRHLARFLASIIPGTGDTNFVWAKK